MARITEKSMHILVSLFLSLEGGSAGEWLVAQQTPWTEVTVKLLIRSFHRTIPKIHPDCDLLQLRILALLA